jgi:uncharacterized membrane protein
MSKFLKIVGVVAILVIVPRIIMTLMAPEGSGSDSKSQIVSMVKEMNSALPKDLGAGTTLSKVDFDGNTVKYFYVLDASSSFAISQKGNYESNLLNLACGTMKEILKQGVSITFNTTYVDSGASNTFETVIAPGRCP